MGITSLDAPVAHQTTGNKVYYYLVESKQIEGKPRLKVIKYLGTQKPTPEETERLIREIKGG